MAVEITDQFRLCSQSIEQAVLELFRRDPFYAHIALRLPRIIDPLVATASVGISGLGIVLRINPTFWMSLKLLKYRVAILKHELLHIALDHLVRQSSFSNSKLFNIAADLAINVLYVGSDELPEGALLISDFTDPQREAYIIELKVSRESAKLSSYLGRSLLKSEYFGS